MVNHSVVSQLQILTSHSLSLRIFTKSSGSIVLSTTLIGNLTFAISHRRETSEFNCIVALKRFVLSATVLIESMFQVRTFS